MTLIFILLGLGVLVFIIFKKKKSVKIKKDKDILTIIYTYKNSYTEIENEICELINLHRESLNLSTLIKLNKISGVSKPHTIFMIKEGKISHDNFQQRAEWLTNNVDAKTIGENVGYGYNSARGFFNSWLNSSGHKKVIEKAAYTHFGISIEEDNKKRNYCTMNFIKR